MSSDERNTSKPSYVYMYIYIKLWKQLRCVSPYDGQVWRIFTLYLRLPPPFGDRHIRLLHYIDVIMTTMASQITSLTVVYSTVYSDAHQRKHQSSASLAFVWGIHRDLWIPRIKGQLRGKCFHFMTSSWHYICDYCLHSVTGMYDYYTISAITASTRWHVFTIIALYKRLLPPFGDRHVRLLHCICDYCLHVRLLRCMCDYCIHLVTGTYDYYTVCATTASIWWQVRTIITLYVRLLRPFGDRHARLLHCICDYCLHSMKGKYDYYTACAITASIRWQACTNVTLYLRLPPPFGDSRVRLLHSTCDYCLHSMTGKYDYYTICAITASIRWQIRAIITL